MARLMLSPRCWRITTGADSCSWVSPRVLPPVLWTDSVAVDVWLGRQRMMREDVAVLGDNGHLSLEIGKSAVELKGADVLEEDKVIVVLAA